jgi:catechol 2,3-dioxygenase-like lactoylglutathione lyase family enzyme
MAEMAAWLDHVGLAVAGLEAAAAWFCDVFGLVPELSLRVDAIDLSIEMLIHPEFGYRLELLHRPGRQQLARVELEIMRRWRGAAVESGNWVPRRWCVRIVAGRGLPGDRLAAGWVEGAQLCWRAVRRHRPPMDRSRP